MNLHNISKILGSSLEARILLKQITGLSDADLITTEAINLDDDQKHLLDDSIEQRLNGRPLSKIIGYKEFYKQKFLTNNDVLDPRPDSETLIEAVLGYCVDHNWSGRILDIGTGSGCLALTLLAELPNADAVATDISQKALAVAKKNAKNLALDDRIEFLHSDWFESVSGQFNIIISNPPYIETETIKTLAVEVKNHDPILALDGGEDGLMPYKVILPQFKSYLSKGGFFAVEHGVGQCGRIKEIAEGYNVLNSHIHHDLSGHDRVFSYIHK